MKSMMMGGAILLGLAMCLTSCEGTLDDVFGEWSRPTGNNGNTKTTVAVKSVTLDQTTLKKAVGDDAVTLTATVDPSDASDKTVTWKSSDASIAAVDANGKVTFVAAGTATITATATNGTDDTADDKTATCEVTLIDGYAANEYNYTEWDYGDKKVIFTKKTAASVTAVTNSDTDVTWGDGWYTVSGNVTIKGKVTLSAHTSLILQDGATLTINGQLNAASYDLYIYGQAEGTGKLNVTCNDGDALYGAPGYCLRIHGGEITATTTGATHRGVYFGYIAIFSGKLTATAADCYAIGFNAYGFAVFGGEVEATSNATSGDLSGIQSSGPLRVYVGKVKGTGGAPSGKGFGCKVQSGTSNIKFYFSNDGATWDAGTYYGDETLAPGNRYAKAE